MVEYRFSKDAYMDRVKNIDEINFLYHINTFDWPIEHGHIDYWEFMIIARGSVINISDGVSTVYNENEVFISTTKNIHSLISANSNPIRYINISIREVYLKKLLNQFYPELSDYLTSPEFKLTLSSQIVSKIENTLRCISYFEPGKYRENDRLACSAFMILLSEILLSQVPNATLAPSYLTVLNILERDGILIKCNVNDLCKYMGYTRLQLNVIFKRHFGTPPHQYLTNYKLTYACRLLLATNMKISEIAEAIGYTTSMQFHETFKKRFGVTPSKYRKMHNTG